MRVDPLPSPPCAVRRLRQPPTRTDNSSSWTHLPSIRRSHHSPTPTPSLSRSLSLSLSAGRAAGHIQKMCASGDITPAFNHTVFSSAEAHSPAGERTVTGEPSSKSVAGERTLHQARVATPTRLESTSGGGFADLAKVRNWADLQMWIANGEVGDGGIGDTRPPAPRAGQEATQPEMQMPAGVGV